MAIDQPERAADGRLPSGQHHKQSEDAPEASGPFSAAGFALRTASQELRELSRALREYSRELRARNPNGSR